MKRVLIASLVLAISIPVCAFAQSAFNGTWEARLGSIRNSGKPMVVQLRDGMFECSCSPPVKVKANGQDQPVTGQPGFDTVAVQVVDPHTIRVVYKDHGKVVTDETNTASGDGKTGTYTFTDNSGSTPVTGKAVVVRVAKGAPGSNAVAGTWKFGHWVDLSPNARTFTYKVDGKSISYSDPTGKSYTAEIGGKAVVGVNPSDPGQAVAVTQLGPNELRETFSRDGRVVGTSTMTVAVDGKTMTLLNRNARAGRSRTAIADKQ